MIRHSHGVQARALGALMVAALVMLLGGTIAPAVAASDHANTQGDGQSADTHGQSADTHGQSADTHGQSADTHGQSADTHGQSADAHGQSAQSNDSTATQEGTAADHATNGTAGTSGDPTQPQPLSNADQNTGGANGKCPGGPYCSTRDGSPSLNGNGVGKATGKPCAGCVGKADNKNPKGQYPNGSDHNAGYECDTNHGIGRSNPAHTGCTNGTVTPPTGCVDNPQTSMDECSSTSPPEVCVPTPAHHCGQVTPPGGGNAGGPPPSTQVSPPHVTRSVSSPRSAAVPASTSPTAATLPNTGAPSMLLPELAAGLLLLGGGLALTRLSTRSRRARG